MLFLCILVTDYPGAWLGQFRLCGKVDVRMMMNKVKEIEHIKGLEPNMPMDELRFELNEGM